ncbi:MAG: DUF3987 domain-containing protein [Bacteroidota bacterium]
MENKGENYLEIWSSSEVNQSETTSNQISDLSTNTNKVIDIENKNEINFPLNGMPNVILDCVNDLSDVYGSPKEFFLMSFLVACCAAVRKKAILDDGRYKNYPVLWVMHVAHSGVGKTEPNKKAFKPLVQTNIEYYRTYKEEIVTWKNKCKSIKNPNDYPVKPILHKILIDDTTPEALYQALNNNSGLTLYSDEFSIWFDNIGRYAKSGEVGRYLSIFDNTTFDISRTSDEPHLIVDPLLNIIGGIQPNVLSETLKKHQMRNNGFAQRFLFVYPKHVVKKHYSTLVPNQLLLTKYDKLIRYLSDTDFGTLTLTTDAKAEFIRFSNELTDKVNDTKSEYLKSLYSKFDIHCLRIALILELIKSYSDNPVKPIEVSFDTIVYAIEICRYFIYCGLKVEKLGSENYEKTEIDKISVAKFLVKECGYSQNSVAKILKVSQQYVNKELKK